MCAAVTRAARAQVDAGPPEAAVLHCLQHCHAVAAALRCDLRTCALSLQVYHTREASAALCAAALRRFWAEGGSEEGGEGDEVVQDLYLQVRRDQRLRTCRSDPCEGGDAQTRADAGRCAGCQAGMRARAARPVPLSGGAAPAARLLRGIAAGVRGCGPPKRRGPARLFRRCARAVHASLQPSPQPLHLQPFPTRPPSR